MDNNENDIEISINTTPIRIDNDILYFWCIRKYEFNMWNIKLWGNDKSIDQAFEDAKSRLNEV